MISPEVLQVCQIRIKSEMVMVLAWLISHGMSLKLTVWGEYQTEQRLALQLTLDRHSGVTRIFKWGEGGKQGICIHSCRGVSKPCNLQ